MFDFIPAFLTAIGISPSHLFAGLAGAFVRTVIQGKKLTWAMLSAALVGSFCAIYLTPLVAAWLGIAVLNVAANNGLAFAIGILGLSLAEGAFKMANRWAEDPQLPETLDVKGIAEVVNSKKVEHVETTVISVAPVATKPRKARKPRTDKPAE